MPIHAHYNYVYPDTHTHDNCNIKDRVENTGKHKT